MSDLVITEEGNAPEQTTWTWRERIAAMAGPPRNKDFASRKEYNQTLAMYQYYTNPAIREKRNAKRMALYYKKKAEEALNGKQPERRGRPPKVFTTPLPSVSA